MRDERAEVLILLQDSAGAMPVLQGFSLARVPSPFTLVDDTPLAPWRVACNYLGCASAIISACALYSNRATENAYRVLPRRLS